MKPVEYSIEVIVPYWDSEFPIRPPVAPNIKLDGEHVTAESLIHSLQYSMNLPTTGTIELGVEENLGETSNHFKHTTVSKFSLGDPEEVEVIFYLTIYYN